MTTFILSIYNNITILYTFFSLPNLRLVACFLNNWINPFITMTTIGCSMIKILTDIELNQIFQRSEWIVVPGFAYPFSENFIVWQINSSSWLELSKWYIHLVICFLVPIIFTIKRVFWKNVFTPKRKMFYEILLDYPLINSISLSSIDPPSVCGIWTDVQISPLILLWIGLCASILSFVLCWNICCYCVVSIFCFSQKKIAFFPFKSIVELDLTSNPSISLLFETLWASRNSFKLSVPFANLSLKLSSVLAFSSSFLRETTSP